MPGAVSRLVLAPVAVALLAGSAVVALPQGVSRRDADRMQQKIVAIAERGLVPRRTPLRTAVTESEINSYLAIYAAPELPAGVVGPRLSILGSQRVAARAIIDLDAIRRQGSGGWLDPASYLTGRLPVVAQGTLQTQNGVARFRLESAQVSGITIPKGLLQQIVSYYSRTPDYPNGIDLDDPFPLPAGIRQIEMQRGQAVVVQQ